MPTVLRRFVDPACMLPESEQLGEVPDIKPFYRSILKIAVPAMVESALVSLVTVVDTAMVGTLGTESIAAVGITGQPRFVVLVPFFALNVGITAVVSRRVGQKDYADANRCVRQATLIALILSSLLCVVAWFGAAWMMRFMGAAEAIVPDAVLYYRYILLGIPFTAASMAVNAAQRGAGNTRISARTNIVANLVNVFFNYLLIGGNFGFPRLGVAGAAIATSLGYTVAFLMSCHSLTGEGHILNVRLRDGGFLPQADMIKSLVGVSWSAAVEQLFLRIGFIVFIRMVSSLGTVAFATHQICMNLFSLSFSVAGEGIGIATSALVGQSLGRERPDMARIYGRGSLVVALCSSVAVVALFTLFPRPIMGLFDRNPAVIALGTPILFIVAATAPGQMAQAMFSGCLRGAGDTRIVALAAFVATTFVRPFVGWVFCYPLGFGVVGAWIGILADMYMRLIVVYWRFHQGAWTKIKV